MQANCTTCDKEVEVGPENGLLTIYEKQPWFSWLGFVCKKCGTSNGTFFGEEWEDYIKACFEEGLGFCDDEEKAPREVVEQYDGVYDSDFTSLIWPSGFTSRQQGEILDFHLDLMQVAGPDDFERLVHEDE
jgi:hypothetical protein